MESDKTRNRCQIISDLHSPKFVALLFWMLETFKVFYVLEKTNPCSNSSGYHCIAQAQNVTSVLWQR